MTKPYTTFEKLLITAEARLWADFQAASEYAQTGDIGDGREATLVKFLQEHLPGRYCVTSGEAIDSRGNQSGQIDIMVYDSSTTRPLLDDGKNVLLPAEALLATIEVKTKLTAVEIKKSILGIKKIRELKPWDSYWGISRKINEKMDSFPRIFSTIFAYDTDMSKKSWDSREMDRVRIISSENNLPVEYIDRVTVLDRGIFLPASGRAMRPNEAEGVLGVWFFNLVNFLDREVRRRKPFPWDSYQIRDKKVWNQLLPPINDAPVVNIPSNITKKKSRLKAIKASPKNVLRTRH